MKRILTALLAAMPMLAWADTKISNYYEETVPRANDYLVLAQPDINTNAKMSMVNFTNPLANWATNAAYSATNGYIWTNVPVSTAIIASNVVQGANLNTMNTVTATNFYSAGVGSYIGNGGGLSNVVVTIANVTTPGQILTNGNSTAATISNNFYVTGNMTNATATIGTISISGGTLSSAGAMVVQAGTSQALSLGAGAANHWAIQNGSGAFYAATDNGKDLGLPSQRVRNIYMGGCVSNNLNVSGFLTATNGTVILCKPSFTTNFTCTTNLQVYFCNGTNQWITLPNAANVPGVVYRVCTTNGWARVIITNATGTQTIRDGTSLSHTQIGVGNPSFISDGSAWWPASKIRTIFPNAQFSCSTNIPLTLANTEYRVTFNSTDFNNSQGIALLAGTGADAYQSKMWITNSGQYEFTPSVVFAMGNVSHTLRYWFKSNDTNIPNSCTPVKLAGNDVACVTVPFVINITEPTAIEIWAQSDGTGDSLSAAAASGNYPATPSIICPVKRISDTWP